VSAKAVATLSALALDAPVQVVVDDVTVCLVRTAEGVRAVNDVCSHADVSLCEGEVDGDTIECWLHGSRFDLTTGRPTGLPATEPVAVYPVTVEDDTVLVDVSHDRDSDPSNADLTHR
jgi:3-phenylpropionate/trans-cinnamate dioxygenase ferredoxin component